MPSATPDVIARLAGVAGLAGRVLPAAKLAELQARNQLPQVTPAAFVIGSGLSGGPVVAASGMFIQGVDRATTVILFVRIAGDATGAATAAAIEPIVDDVVEAICGWGPDAAIGVHRLSRGELVSFASGMAIYQLDFILDDQLRILPA